jgi:dihydropteroate synthase
MKPPTHHLEWPSGRLDFTGGCRVMGILNVTPDSFSDGGDFLDVDRAVTRGIEMVQQGAAIIDIGAESTRPGAAPVAAVEQIRRAVPIIQKLRQQVTVPISIDTRQAAVAEAAIEAGASMLNDISALEDEAMAVLAAQKQVPVVLMHIQGTPETMQQAPQYDDVVAEVMEFLMERAKYAEVMGIARERIFLDPGIGFGKTTDHNLCLLKRLELFCELGYRVLVGTSRKRFIGQLTGKDRPAERLAGTAATVALAAMKGASIVRVHDVAEMVDVVRIVSAVQNAVT